MCLSILRGYLYPAVKIDEDKWDLGRWKMQNFVLSGKAKTVFRIIELKAKREEIAKRNKKQDSKNKK